MLFEDIDIVSTLLLLAVVGLAPIFIYGLYRVLRPTRKTRHSREEPRHPGSGLKHAGVNAGGDLPTKLTVTSSDISAIAGNDVMATQLDLARAYIETGRHLLAKKILDHVREHGNTHQQSDAYELLRSI